MKTKNKKIIKNNLRNAFALILIVIALAWVVTSFNFIPQGSKSAGLIIQHNFSVTTEIYNGTYNLSTIIGAPQFVTPNVTFNNYHEKVGRLSPDNSWKITNNSYIDLQQKNRTINLWVLLNNSCPNNGYLLSNDYADWTLEFSSILSTLTFNPPTAVSVSAVIPVGSWFMITLVANLTDIEYWVNATKIGYVNYTFIWVGDLNIGTNKDGDGDINGAYIDELGVWKRNLNGTDILDLYNEYLLDYHPSSLEVTLNYPANNSIFLSPVVEFNSTANGTNINSFINATLWIWKSDNSVYNNTEVMIPSVQNTTTREITKISTGTYLWNYYWCGANLTGSSFCDWGNNYTFTKEPLIINQSSFNNLSYETTLEDYIINFSFDSSSFTLSNVNLVYNQTSYSGTVKGSGVTYGAYATTYIPLINAPEKNKTLYWEFIYTNSTDTFYKNSTFNNQTIKMINLSVCGIGSGATYINFSFKNETAAQNKINVSIPLFTTYYWTNLSSLNRTLTYSNLAEEPNLVLCFSPNSTKIMADISFTYENTYSQQRSYTTNEQFSNSTTARTLFLLPYSYGHTVTFVVINLAEQTIKNAKVNITQSTYGLIGSSTTDDAGSVSFFLNPNIAYTITVDATGSEIYEATIIPTDTSYTIQISGGTTTTNITDYYKDITYSVNPNLQYLINKTTYLFNFSVASSYWSLDGFGMALKNSSGFLYSSNHSANNGGVVSSYLNTGSNESIYMYYYWTINGTNVSFAKNWIVFNDAGTDWSIKNLFTDLKTYLTGGNFFGLTPIGLNIIIFFSIVLIVGIVSYSFSLTSPTLISGFFVTLVILFDVLGLITYSPVFSNNYAISIFSVLALIGIAFWESR